MNNQLVKIGDIKEHKSVYSRTLVEKVEAYKTSDGKLFHTARHALAHQRMIDMEERIDLLIQPYAIEIQDNEIGTVYPRWAVRLLLGDMLRETIIKSAEL